MLRIPAEAEKGNRDRLLPMAPEFAQLLQSVPKSERRGRVFKLLDVDGSPLQGGRCVVGKFVSAIGKSANVLVNERRQSALAPRPPPSVWTALGTTGYADRTARADAA